MPAIINNIYGKLKNDRELRGFITSSFSFFATVVFTVYNAVIGIMQRTLWNQSITVYYLFLMILRSLILFSEKRWRSLKQSSAEKKRRRLLICVSVILAVLDIAMIIPITLMVISEREVEYSSVFAIATAAYSTYKLTLATVSWRKTAKRGSLQLYGLKIISLKDALMSVLILQNTLISVFGDGESMLALTAYTSAGILALMAALTVFMILRLRENKIKHR